MASNLSSMLTPLLSVENNRAYSNLFEVKFNNNEPKSPSTTDQAKAIIADTPHIPLLAKKVSFEDSFGTDVELNTAIQGFTIKGPQRIKGLTIVFKETAQYHIIDLFKEWLNSIYNFKEHYYYARVSPEIGITIKLADGNNNHIFTVDDAILKSLSYPEYDWGTSTPIDITTTFSCGRISFDKENE